jgi:hypothetical protein
MVQGRNALGEQFTTWSPDQSQTTSSMGKKEEGTLELVELNHMAFDSDRIEECAELWVRARLPRTLQSLIVSFHRSGTFGTRFWRLSDESPCVARTPARTLEINA